MPLSQIFRQLRSLNFTLVLLALLIILSAFATFSEEPGAFFNSLGFFAIVFLFFVNLTCCTVYRFARELKKKSSRNFGPDILHGGCILFMLVALLSAYSRMEGQIALVEGESVQMPNGLTVTLDKFENLRYDDGRPRDYISHLTITDGDRVINAGYPLRVNHPLEVDGYTLYQASYGEMGGGVYSVINAVKEPLFGLVLAAFILSGAGIFISLFIKLSKIRRRTTDND